MLANFLFGVCGCQKSWTMKSFVREATEEIRATVGDKRVVLGLSGGVDSSVAAVLIHRAIGRQLTCVFVDNGLLRLDEGGKLLDPQGVLISGGAGNQSSPRVAFDGTTFVVVWEDYRSGQRYDIYGARVALDGKVLDPAGIKLAGSDKAGRHRVAPALARSKGGGVLVEWNGHLVNGVGQLAGGLLLAGGAITKTFVIDGKTGETPGDRHTPVRAAGSSSGYVLVWRNYVPVGRVDPSGNPNLLQLDPAGSVTSRSVVGSTGIVDPDVTWDGSASLVAWHEQRGKGDTKQHTGPSDAVYLQRLASGATEISVAGTFASPARRARLASGGDGETLVVYERHPEQATTPIRIGVRLAH